MLPDANCRERLVRFFCHADGDSAERVRARGCPHCGSALHAGHYQRKLFGLDGWGGESGVDLSRRYSWCCGRDGCRRRAMPPSVTFLDRRRYAHVVVLLLVAMTQGPSAAIARTLREDLGVDRRTLGRWREWWQATFPRTCRWLAIRARFATPIATSTLPASLLAALSPSPDEATHVYFRLLASEAASDQPSRGS